MHRPTETSSRGAGSTGWLTDLVRRCNPSLAPDAEIRRRVLNLRSTSSVVYAVEAVVGEGRVTDRWILKLAREKSEQHSREVAFYRRTSGRLSGLVPTCLEASDEGDSLFLLLEDVSPQRQTHTPDLAGPRVLSQVVSSLADVHAGTWNGTDEVRDQVRHAPIGLEGGDCATELDEITDDMGERWRSELSVADLERLRTAPRRYGEMRKRLSQALTVCHGDFHTMNVFTGGAGPRVIDWQECYLGNPAEDLATFLSAYVHPLDRRRLTEELVLIYHRRISHLLGQKVYPMADLRNDLHVSFWLALRTPARLTRVAGLADGAALMRAKHVLDAVAAEYGDDDQP